MSLDLYPSIILEGDLSPDAYGSDVDAVCQEIYEACKGFGTDEDRLLKAMGGMTPAMRCKVYSRYKQLHNKDLKDLMKSECGSRDFGTALKILALPPDAADCYILKLATKGMGAKENILFPVVCGRSNKEMQILKKKFFDVNTQDLGVFLDKEMKDEFEQLIFNVLQAAEEEYDPDYHNNDKMAADVQTLYKMGQGKWGTNEKGMFKILCAAPPEYLKKLNLLYAEKHGYTLLKVLDKELGGDVREAALFHIGMKLKPYETVAGRIKAACQGFGTDELALTSLLIRYQPIMKQVMVAHVELYQKTVADRVKSETGGDYRKVLLKVLETAEHM